MVRVSAACEEGTTLASKNSSMSDQDILSGPDLFETKASVEAFVSNFLDAYKA